jgi:acyl carrier protein
MEFTLESVESRIRAIIARALKVDASQIGPDTDLMKELGADSLDAITIAMDVDDEFKITVDDKELGSFSSCRQIASAVMQHLGMRMASTGNLPA